MDSPAPPRPRVVEVAFWLLVVAALALITTGLVVVFSSSPLPPFFRGAGVLFAVAGAALAFVAGRTRGGDARFRSATIGLALALVVLLALFSLFSRGLAWLLIMVVLMVAAILLLRPAAHDWFVDR